VKRGGGKRNGNRETPKESKRAKSISTNICRKKETNEKVFIKKRLRQNELKTSTFDARGEGKKNYILLDQGVEKQKDKRKTERKIGEGDSTVHPIRLRPLSSERSLPRKRIPTTGKSRPEEKMKMSYFRKSPRLRNCRGASLSFSATTKKKIIVRKNLTNHLGSKEGRKESE